MYGISCLIRCLIYHTNNLNCNSSEVLIIMRGALGLGLNARNMNQKPLIVRVPSGKLETVADTLNISGNLQLS